MRDSESPFDVRELSAEDIIELRDGGRLDLDLLLTRDLWDGRTFVRRNAAAGIALFEDVAHPRFSVLSIACKDGDPIVREHVARALGNVGLSPAEAVPVLVRARLDRVHAVAEAALRSLERLMLRRPSEVAPLLVAALGSGQPLIVQTAADLLLLSGAHAVRPLVTCLAHPDAACADLALALLERLGSMTTDAALDALEDPGARTRAARLLHHHLARQPAQRDRLTALGRHRDAVTAALAKALIAELAHLDKQVAAPAAPLPHPELMSRELATDELDAVAASAAPGALERLCGASEWVGRLNVVRALARVATDEQWAAMVSPFISDVQPEVRRAAVSCLRQRPNARTAGLVLRATRDADDAVRTEGRRALSALAVHDIAAAVEATAMAPSDAAIETLCATGPECAQALASTGLVAPSARTRALSATVLGRMRVSHPRVQQALVQATRDIVDDVRGRAAWALGQMGASSEDVTAALEVMSRDPVSGVRRQAYLALTILQGKPLPARTALEAVDEPLPGFFSHPLDPSVLGRAAKGIGVDALVGFLADGRAAARRNAAVALGALGVEASEAAIALDVCLRDEDGAVREATVAALSAVAASNAQERALALVAALHDRSAAVRAAAEQVLEELGATALDALIEAFDEDAGFVRGYVFPLVVRLGDDAMTALVASLARSSPRRRSMAAELLGRMGTYAHTPTRKALEAAVAGDPDLAVRSAARRSVERLRTEDQAQRTRETTRLPMDAFDERLLSIAEISKAKKNFVKEELLRILNDGRGVVRANTAIALGVLGGEDEETVTGLSVRLRDSEPMVRLAAATALGTMGGQAAARAIPALLGALRGADPELERVIIGTLSGLPTALEAQVPAFLAQRPETVMPTLGRLAQRQPELVLRALASAVADAPSLVARENAADVLTMLGARAEPATEALLKALAIDEVLLRCKLLRAIALAATPTVELVQRLEEVGDADSHLAVTDAVEAAVRIVKARMRRP